MPQGMVTSTVTCVLLLAVQSNIAALEKKVTELRAKLQPAASAKVCIPASRSCPLTMCPVSGRELSESLTGDWPAGDWQAHKN